MINSEAVSIAKLKPTTKLWWDMDHSDRLVIAQWRDPKKLRSLISHWETVRQLFLLFAGLFLLIATCLILTGWGLVLSGRRGLFHGDGGGVVFALIYPLGMLGWNYLNYRIQSLKYIQQLEERLVVMERQYPVINSTPERTMLALDNIESRSNDQPEG